MSLIASKQSIIEELLIMLKDTHQLHLEMLLQVLQLLSSPYEQQVQAFPAFVCIVDEIALAFDDVFLFVDELITSQQKSELELLNQLFPVFDQDPHFWTLQALEQSSQWMEIRRVAGQILRSFHVQPEEPRLFWLTYVPEERSHRIE